MASDCTGSLNYSSRKFLAANTIETLGGSFNRGHSLTRRIQRLRHAAGGLREAPHGVTQDRIIQIPFVNSFRLPRPPGGPFADGDSPPARSSIAAAIPSNKRFLSGCLSASCRSARSLVLVFIKRRLPLRSGGEPRIHARPRG